MHIPDGMLSGPVTAAAGIGAGGFTAYAVAWVRRHMDQRKIVLMAVLAALVFALQMLNFPVAGGTSGHFAGGAAVAILLGPWPALIVMTTVLLVQALMFADGGILALGANVLNLGVIAPLVGYAVWRAVTRFGDSKAILISGAFAAAWASITVAALAAGLELWLSGRAPLLVVLGAMGFWHALIGVGEGVITAGLIAYVMATRPDLVTQGRGSAHDSVRGVAIGLGVLAFIAGGLSFLASSHPDGLEYVYETVGADFTERALVASPIPDYAVPGLDNEAIAVVLAAIVGIIVTGALLWSVFSVARSRRSETPTGS
jgi:cobalt/nickel transport system permease protein